ncbi:MAG: D-glycero-beta-D-manno-heptose 1,7-bisphosphate 7-phosphatase [Dissulfurimicrobium sp.]
MKTRRKAVFLDRDGTINIEMGYLGRPEELVLIDTAAEAIAMLNGKGYAVAVITNQSGVARGLFEEKDVKAIHEEIARRLLRSGARVDGWYYCPHHPSEGVGRYNIQCNCRKPLTGMIEAASNDLDVDISESFVVGDSIRDMELAWNSGAKAVLVLTGFGLETLKRLARQDKKNIVYIAADILDASKFICGS